MSYSIIKADIDTNKDDIIGIWKKNSERVITGRYDWIYKNCPGGKTQAWLIKDDKSGEFVGVTALFPVKMIIQGVLKNAAIAGDLFMNKNHRIAGPALMLQREVISSLKGQAFDLIYSFPNKASEPVLKRTGYKILGDKIRLVKILKTQNHLSRLPAGKIWAPVIGPIINSIARLWSFETWKIISGTYRTEIVNNFDDRFDRLWERVGTRFSGRSERSQAMLEWKYLKSPYNQELKHFIFALSNAQDKELAGYIICRRIENTFEIRDVLYDRHSDFVNLFSGFLKYVRRLKADTVSMTLMNSDNIFIENMKKLGFHERKEDEKVLIYLNDLKDESSYQTTDNKDWLLFQCEDDM
ncbi:MAG: hypothetical protein AB7T22_01250 [Calditrichaceae bacterium]